MATNHAHSRCIRDLSGRTSKAVHACSSPVPPCHAHTFIPPSKSHQLNLHLSTYLPSTGLISSLQPTPSPCLLPSPPAQMPQSTSQARSSQQAGSTQQQRMWTPSSSLLLASLSSPSCRCTPASGSSSSSSSRPGSPPPAHHLHLCLSSSSSSRMHLARPRQQRLSPPCSHPSSRLLMPQPAACHSPSWPHSGVAPGAYSQPRRQSRTA